VWRDGVPEKEYFNNTKATGMNLKGLHDIEKLEKDLWEAADQKSGKIPN
jgi:hypothetical protein